MVHVQSELDHECEVCTNEPRYLCSGRAGTRTGSAQDKSAMLHRICSMDIEYVLWTMNMLLDHSTCSMAIERVL